ncbi:hypothetical protein GVAMD_0679 [Gardnerella vaginalis AMD]|nr:hypothetical protein GVAMD_0679 [Gardnerella vaginalis AMD]
MLHVVSRYAFVIYLLILRISVNADVNAMTLQCQCNVI